MTMLDPVAADRLERSRRRAILILTSALGLAGVFCLFMSINIINPPSRLTPGPAERLPAIRPRSDARRTRTARR